MYKAWTNISDGYYRLWIILCFLGGGLQIILQVEFSYILTIRHWLKKDICKQATWVAVILLQVDKWGRHDTHWHLSYRSLLQWNISDRTDSEWVWRWWTEWSIQSTDGRGRGLWLGLSKVTTAPLPCFLPPSLPPLTFFILHLIVKVHPGTSWWTRSLHENSWEVQVLIRCNCLEFFSSRSYYFSEEALRPSQAVPKVAVKIPSQHDDSDTDNEQVIIM